MRSRRHPLLGPLVILLLATAGCRSAGPAPEPTTERAPDLPPASAFFGDPPLSHPRLSPDGARLLGVASLEGKQVLVTSPLRGGEITSLAKLDDPEASIAAVGWSGDRMAMVAVDWPEEKALEIEEGVRPEGRGSTVRRGGRAVLFSAFEVDRFRPQVDADVWRMSLAGREPVPDPLVLHWLPDEPLYLLLSQPGIAGSTTVRRSRVGSWMGGEVSPPVPEGFVAERWHVDAQGRVRAATLRDPEGFARSVYARADGEGPLVAVGDVDVARESTLAFAGFSEDPGVIYVYADTAQGRRAVYAYDLRAGRRTDLVASHDLYDIGRLVYAPGSERLVAVETEGERPGLSFVDADAAREQASIDATFPGTRNRVIAWDREGDTALLRVSGDTRPPELFLYDRADREMHFLSASRPDLDPASLATMEPVGYPAADGREIPAYLTLPRGAAHEGLPLIVIVHDGPTDRHDWGWNARVQFLASRGFAVLQPNPRGSSGYGREFERAGYAAWGEAMQRDLADGVAWLVSRGIVDSARVGIFGEGYGGYAALMAPLVSPGTFRAAASWGGVFDLARWIEDPDRIALDDPNTPLAWATPRDLPRLPSLSPTRRAAEIDVPVLLGHGQEDERVPTGESRALASALEDAGVPVETHFYRDVGTELRNARDRIGFHEALADFFTRHLAPRRAAGGGR